MNVDKDVHFPAFLLATVECMGVVSSTSAILGKDVIAWQGC